MSLPLYSRKRTADNGHISFDKDGCHIWRKADNSDFVKIGTELHSDIPRVTSKQDQHSQYLDFEDINREFREWVVLKSVTQDFSN